MVNFNNIQENSPFIRPFNMVFDWKYLNCVTKKESMCGFYILHHFNGQKWFFSTVFSLMVNIEMLSVIY